MVRIATKSFEDRTDLTDGEKEAIRSYRDLEYPQNSWSIKVSGRKQKDCDVINGCLRNPNLEKQLNIGERKLYHSLVYRLTKAINKSVIKSGVYLYKGLHEFDGLSKFKEGAYVQEFGFYSFSESVNIAKKYSGKNKSGEFIFFMLSIAKDSKAMFVDKKEREWIFQKGLVYHVYGIEHVNNELFGKAIIYHIELT